MRAKKWSNRAFFWRKERILEDRNVNAALRVEKSIISGFFTADWNKPVRSATLFTVRPKYTAAERGGMRKNEKFP